MSDTEVRMMRYTIEQLSAELKATRQYASDIKSKLELTRKALDRAKWWLKEIVENHRYTPISTAEMALKEITALEQKDK